MNKKVVIILIAVTLGVFALGTVAVEAVLSSILYKGSTAFLETMFQNRLETKTTKLSLLPFPALKVKNVIIHNPDSSGFEDAAALRIGKLKMSIDFFALFKKKVIIRSFVMKDCELLYEVNEDGVSNFEIIIEESLTYSTADGSTGNVEITTESSSDQTDTVADDYSSRSENHLEDSEWTFLIKKTKVKDVRIRYINHKAKSAYIFDDIDNNFYFLFDGPNELIETTNSLSVAGVTIKPEDKNSVVLDDARFTLFYDIKNDLKTDNFLINEISSSFNDLSFSLSGVIDSTINLKMKENKLPLKDVISALPAYYSKNIDKSRSKGTLSYSLVIGGDIEKPQFNFTLELDKGKIKYKDLPQEINDISMNLEISDRHFSLSDCSMQFGKSPLSMALNIDFDDTPEADGFLKGKLDLNKIRDVVRLSEGVSLAGTVSGDLGFNGKYRPDNLKDMQYRGELLFNDFQFTNSEFTGSFPGKVRRSPREIMTAYHQFFNSDKSSAEEAEAGTKEWINILLGE